MVNLLSHRGGKPVWDRQQSLFLPGDAVDNISVIGAAAGCWDHDVCIGSGHAAGASAGGGRAVLPPPGGWAMPIKPVYEIRRLGASKTASAKKAFVDFQHDVTTDDIRLAHQEGFVSVEHLKRYTTLGMATDQGKMGNVIGLALMANALGKDIAAVGTTRFRPPYTPVAIGALAGRHVGAHFRPLRQTPLHDWDLAHGATNQWPEYGIVLGILPKTARRLARPISVRRQRCAGQSVCVMSVRWEKLPCRDRIRQCFWTASIPICSVACRLEKRAMESCSATMAW